MELCLEFYLLFSLNTFSDAAIVSNISLFLYEIALIFINPSSF